MSDKYDILCVDARNLLHRVRAVTPKRNVTVGGRTFAAGVASYFVKSLTILFHELAEKGCEVAVCWDGDRSKLERRKWYAGYKGTRVTDETFEEDERSTRTILRMLGIQEAWSPGWEADDVIATLSKRDGRIGILSADHDLLQLQSDRVDILDPSMRHEGWTEPKIWTVEKIMEKYGCTPDRIPEYKALTGDSSDNIPGVGGVGPVKAKDLLGRYGSLYEMLKKDNLENDPVLKKYLAPKREIAKLNLKLCTLNKDVLVQTRWKKPQVALELILGEFKMTPLLPSQHVRAIRAMSKV